MADVERAELLIDQILADNAGRKPSLVRLKLETMAEGVFCFFRGVNDQFARDWPRLAPLDPGPLVLLCGDLHLENFGAFLTEAGGCRFGINDFDEAYVAPCGVDLVRCGASIILASDEWRLSPTSGAGMVVEFLDSYREEIAASAVSRRVGELTARNVEGTMLELLGPTVVRSRDNLIAQQTRHSKRRGHRMIVRGDRTASIGPKKVEAIREAFRALGAAMPVPQTIELVDATTRIAGLGSLGLRRYLALLSHADDHSHLSLVDVKEAAAPALRRCIEVPQPSWADDQARRIIDAERLINEEPVLGLASFTMGGRSFRVRGMVPEANRSKLSRLRRTPEKLREAVQMAGRVAGWAHVRGAIALDEAHPTELSRWVTGPAFDSIMVSAARMADWTRDLFLDFQRALDTKTVRKRLGLSVRRTRSIEAGSS